MSVEGNRNSRFAVCCLLAMFAAVAAPVSVTAQEVESDTETYYDFELPSQQDLLCTDDMIEEPFSNELEPTPAAHADGCMVPELPIAT